MFSKKLYLIIAIVFISLVSCQKKEEAKKEKKIRPVRYQRVYFSGGNRTRTFSGSAEAAQEAKLSFKIGGTLKNIDVKVGQNVKTQEKIAALQKKDYELKYQQAEAAKKQAKAQLQNARTNYNRVKKLYTNKSVSKSDLDKAATNYQSAKAALVSAEKQTELAESQLNYTELKAPFEGNISKIFVSKNENIGPNQPIVTLTGEKKMEVKVNLPEVLISEVDNGDKVSVKFPAIKDLSAEGRISEVSVASYSSATYPVTITLDEKISQLRSGMAAEVKFNFKSNKSKAIIVPPHSVSEDENGRFVFIAVPQEDNLAKTKKVNVTVGEITSKGLEITSGLAEKDLLITAGVSKIKDNMLVKLNK